MRKKFAAVVFGGIAVVSTVTATPGLAQTDVTEVAAMGDVCQVRYQSPHVSTGANGVIFKSRISCAEQRDVYFNGSLWACPVGHDPTGEPVTWDDQGCTLATGNYGDIRSVGSSVVTFYTPDLGTQGGKGHHSWVGVVAAHNLQEGVDSREKGRTRAVDLVG